MKKLLFALALVLAPASSSAAPGPTPVYGLDFAPNSGQPVAPANHYRFRLNGGVLETSYNTGAYSPFAGGLPSMAGQSGRFLTNNGSVASWAAVLSSVFADGPLGGDGTSGNHLTCTTCVVTSGSYADPAWITSLAGSKITSIPQSVSNSDGTLTVSPSTGAVIASLALGHANTWTAAQILNLSAIGQTTPTPGLTLSNPTPAINGTDQYAPAIKASGAIWNVGASTAFVAYQQGAAFTDGTNADPAWCDIFTDPTTGLNVLGLCRMYVPTPTPRLVLTTPLSVLSLATASSRVDLDGSALFSSAAKGLGKSTLPWGSTYLGQINGSAANFRAMASATGLTATPNATPGTTRVDYYVFCQNAHGDYSPGAFVYTRTANAMIDNTNSVTVSWTPPTGSTSCDLVRDRATGTPSSTGSISLANTTGTFTDIGTAASAYTNKTGNSSADLYADGALALGSQTVQPYAIYSKGQGGIYLAALAAPGVITVGVQGAGGVSTWYYNLIKRDRQGNKTVANGALQGTTVGNSTLSTTNFNRLTWAADSSATCYDIQRLTAATSPATIGKIATCFTGTTFDDTGLPADGVVVAPARNLTADLHVDGMISAGSTTPGVLKWNSPNYSPAQWSLQSQQGCIISLDDGTGALISCGGSSFNIPVGGGLTLTGPAVFTNSIGFISDNTDNVGSNTIRPAKAWFSQSLQLGGTSASPTNMLDVYGNSRFRGIPTPATPVLSGAGSSGGGTSWTYYQVAKRLDGTKISKSATVTTAVGKATLDTNNPINITIVATPGASSYDIVRSGAGGTPNTTGLIGTLSGSTLSLSDTGLAGGGAYTDPSGHNVSADVIFDGDIRLGGDVAANLATCDSTLRGTFRYTNGVTGGGATADTLQVCMKDNADAYSWVTK